MGFKIPAEPNQALESGTWTSYQDADFLIAHAGNAKFQRTMARLQKPFRRKIEKGEMDPVDQKKVLIQAISESILLDWKGVDGDDGQPAQYDRKLGQKLLANDESFREFVMEFAMDLQNFKDEEMEHEGNS